MRIALGSDHGGYELKRNLKDALADSGHDLVDLGTDSEESVDYPDFALPVARKVASGECDLGVLVCGTGIGVSITANKVAGVRAALVHDVATARLAREHNRANILCLGGRILAPSLAEEMVRVWLDAEFEERHQARLDKITEIERNRE